MARLTFTIPSIVLLAIIYVQSAEWQKQNAYDVNLQRTELNYYNESIVRDVAVQSYKITRNDFGFNVTGELLVVTDASQHATVRFQAYKFTSNEYRLKLADFTADLCECIRRKFYSNVTLRYADTEEPVRDCPLRVGTIHAYNQRITAGLFPPNVPSGAYKLQVAMLLQHVQVLRVSVYFELVYRQRRGN